MLPPQHRDQLIRTLNAAPEINVLVLGYSALDTEVLDLLARNNACIRRLTVVNRDAASALEVYRRIEGHGIRAIWPDTYDGGYEEWIDGDGLHDWVKEFGGVRDGPYPSLTSPEQLEGRLVVRAYELRLLMEREGIMDEEW